MIGMAFGPRLGAITILAYLRRFGAIPVLIGPSGGYLVGFVAAAFVIGLLAQRGMDPSPARHWSC